MKQLSLTSLFANSTSLKDRSAHTARRVASMDLKIGSPVDARPGELRTDSRTSDAPASSPATTPPAAPNKTTLALQRQSSAPAPAPAPARASAPAPARTSAPAQKARPGKTAARLPAPKRQKHIKQLKDGLPPLDVLAKLTIERRNSGCRPVSERTAAGPVGMGVNTAPDGAVVPPTKCALFSTVLLLVEPLMVCRCAGPHLGHRRVEIL